MKTTKVPANWKRGNRQLNGFKFDLVLSYELNDFMHEALLPELFFWVESEGKRRSENLSLMCPDDLAQELLKKGQLESWANCHQKLLQDWLEGFICKIGKVMKGQQKIIQFVYPFTYNSLRTTIAESNLVRKIPEFLYKVLLETGKHTKSELRELFRYYFSKGLKIKQSSDGRPCLPDFYYDGKTPISPEILLSVYASQQYDTPKVTSQEFEQLLPLNKTQAMRIGNDILLFLRAYASYLPVQELIERLIILITFELWVYTLQIMNGIKKLILEKKLPPFFANNLPQFSTPDPFYVSCTDEPASVRIAKEMIQQHFSLIREHIQNQILLRTADYLLEEEAFDSVEIQNLLGRRKTDPWSYLEELIKWIDGNIGEGSNNILVNAARRKVRELNQYLINLLNEDTHQNNGGAANSNSNFIAPTLVPFINVSNSSIIQLSQIISFLQLKKAASNIEAFFKFSGNLEKENGFLRTLGRTKEGWYYYFSNDLLWVLVHLVAAKQVEDTGSTPKYLRLKSFLECLQREYGVLIATMPRGYDQYIENMAIAEANKKALQRKLAQMGLLKNLSDDFEAQFIEISITQS